MKRQNIFLFFLAIGMSQLDGNVKLDNAFISAIKKNNSEQVQELLQLGADVLTPIPYIHTDGDCDWKVQTTPLIYAARQNRPDLVRELLKVKQNTSKAFEIAIKEGALEVVDELIRGGADINHTDENKNTLLILAVENARASAEFSLQAQQRSRSLWKKRRAIIQSLLQAGANINAANKYGRTALIEAIVEHDLHTVESLLEASKLQAGSFLGFINHADIDGNTALIHAVKKTRTSYINNQEYNICVNSQKILSTLLEIPEADPDHANKNGETARKLFLQSF
ncbi:MAG: hypothetical protein SP4CHLAM5_02040 [Chlamydiia bacterium]|nr:hypothetical protein [Chlamydiia bacterium]MCH9618078.1 hypothetical protein [Chlamydiia bacterium]MCH9624202.1 hypothetical protein [Chlamydiia bacterium]